MGLLGTKFQFFFLPDMKKELFEKTLWSILPMGVLANWSPIWKITIINNGHVITWSTQLGQCSKIPHDVGNLEHPIKTIKMHLWYIFFYCRQTLTSITYLSHAGHPTARHILNLITPTSKIVPSYPKNIFLLFHH